MRPSLFAPLALLVALAPPARAAEPQANCDSPMSTAEINICSDREYAKADQALNAVFKKALDKIAKSGGSPPYDARSWEAALRASQRAWIAFRDADCKGDAPMHWSGGSGTTAAVLGCMTEMTNARTKELAGRYEVE